MTTGSTTVQAPAQPLRIGPHVVTPPVVLAPMAGITNQPFRTLCREYGGGLYVSEMITTRALVERDPETMRLIEFGPQETPRSLQLYGVDPAVVREAVTMIVAEDRADHIDLNFGCPVPKVTRRGGGAALPWKRDLLRAVLRAAVRAAGPVPVTMKMRKGIDDDHLTYLDAGRTAEDEGVTAIALHGRTAAQAYSGHADWSAVARLKEHVTSIPVLGNGDVWEAADALRMMAETGCDGVVVGRGCLGRPWLFRSLDRAFAGLPDDPQPDPRRGRRRDAPARRADGRLARRGQGLPRVPQARVLVPQGLRRRRRDPAPAGAGLHARRARRPARHPRRRRAVPGGLGRRAPRPGRLAAPGRAPGGLAGRPGPAASWTPTPSSPSPAADRRRRPSVVQRCRLLVRVGDVPSWCQMSTTNTADPTNANQNGAVTP